MKTGKEKRDETHLMIPFDTLLLFTLTTLVVVLSPGPAVIAVTSEAVSNGFPRTLWMVAGIATGNVIFFILSATGIAALIIASGSLFMTLKWLGVAYLIYLGLRAIFSKWGAFRPSQRSGNRQRLRRVFMRGLLLELANPKALLYFSALLPQFVAVGQPILPQLVLFCLITLLLDLACYSGYGYLAGRSARFKESPRVAGLINKLAGSLLIYTGVTMASFER